jgi:hypothetical protein
MADELKSVPESIHFDYIKSNQFRVIHADGAFFSLSQTSLTISFFAERQPIPRRVTHKVNPDGSIGDEIVDQRVVRDAVVRDTEVAVAMSIETAKRIREKVDEILKKFDELSRQTKEARKQ